MRVLCCCKSLVSPMSGRWIERRGKTYHVLVTIVLRRPFRTGSISTVTTAFDHRLTKVNVTNELICSMADMSGAVAAGDVVGELKCMTDKPMTRSLPLALVGRVKSSGHIAADKPGSYHGQDSSSCRQLPSRTSRGEEVVVVVVVVKVEGRRYVTNEIVEERRNV